MLTLSIVFLLVYGLTVAGLLAAFFLKKGDAEGQEANILRTKLEAVALNAEEFKATLESLRASEGAARVEIARKEESLKGADVELARLRGESETAKKELETTRTSLREAESRSLAQAEALKALKNSFEALRLEANELKTAFSTKSEELLNSSKEASKLKAEFDAASKRLESQDAEMKRLQEEASAKFEVVANKLLEEKGDKFSKLHAERLAEIFGPLKERLGEFRMKVEEIHASDAKDRSALQEQIKQIAEANKKLGDDARKLADALKGDSKLVGDWGETLLDGILEGSGLQEGSEYFKQESVRDGDGKALRPDVVLRLPQGKSLVIDSKVSIAAYLDFCNAKDEAERESAIQRHLRSVKAHLDELDVKAYQAHIDGTLDFVVMFVPNEPAYNLAIHADPSLWQAAFAKKIVMASPTNLFAILKIVSELWRKERETLNFRDIVDKCAALYDKFATFLEFMDRLGKGLEGARKAYDDAIGNLKLGRGNLVGQAERIRQLGLKTRRQIPDAWLDSTDELAAPAQPHALGEEPDAKARPASENGSLGIPDGTSIL